MNKKLIVIMMLIVFLAVTSVTTYMYWDHLEKSEIKTIPVGEGAPSSLRSMEPFFQPNTP